MPAPPPEAPTGSVTIAVVGPPRSGKSTLRRAITGALGIPTVRVRWSDETSAAVGLLAPDAVANASIEDQLTALGEHQACVIDGYPRTVPQAEHLAQVVERQRRQLYLVALHVDRLTAQRRLSSRAAEARADDAPAAFERRWNPAYGRRLDSMLAVVKPVATLQIRTDCVPPDRLSAAVLMWLLEHSHAP